MASFRNMLVAGALGLASFGLIGSAQADNTNSRSVVQLKVWAEYYDIVLSGTKVTCGTSTSDHWKLRVDTANSENMFRLVTSTWLSGREVNLAYTCVGDEARVTGVRAL